MKVLRKTQRAVIQTPGISNPFPPYQKASAPSSLRGHATTIGFDEAHHRMKMDIWSLTSQDFSDTTTSTSLGSSRIRLANTSTRFLTRLSPICNARQTRQANPTLHHQCLGLSAQALRIQQKMNPPYLQTLAWKQSLQPLLLLLIMFPSF